MCSRFCGVFDNVVVRLGYDSLRRGADAGDTVRRRLNSLGCGSQCMDAARLESQRLVRLSRLFYRLLGSNRGDALQLPRHVYQYIIL